MVNVLYGHKRKEKNAGLYPCFWDKTWSYVYICLIKKYDRHLTQSHHGIHWMMVAMTIVKAFPWSYQHNKAESLVNTTRVVSVCPTLLKLIYTSAPGVPKSVTIISTAPFVAFCKRWLVSRHIKKERPGY